MNGAIKNKQDHCRFAQSFTPLRTLSSPKENPLTVPEPQYHLQPGPAVLDEIWMDGPNHGTYIRWYLSTCCARMMLNRSFPKKNRT